MKKNSVKISLGTAVCMFIIIILIVALLGMWYYYNNNEIIETNTSSQNVILSSPELIISNNNYEEITKEFKGIDCLYVTEVVKENNTYTLRGVVYTQHTISTKQLEYALEKGYYVLNGEKYNIKQSDNGYELLNNNFNEYALYIFKELNYNEYYLECLTQISNVWEMTDEYMEITLDGDIPCLYNYYYEGEETTVQKVFNNYGKHEATETTNPADGYTFSFEFENGKCIKVIDFMTSM